MVFNNIYAYTIKVTITVIHNIKYIAVGIMLWSMTTYDNAILCFS